jgi:adenylate cyclase
MVGNVPRRLAGILAADVVGYSRLLGADEAATLARLRSLQHELIDPLMVEHGGRVFKTTGDGLLAEFPSAVQALRCAIAIQGRLRADRPGTAHRPASRKTGAALRAVATHRWPGSPDAL